MPGEGVVGEWCLFLISRFACGVWTYSNAEVQKQPVILCLQLALLGKDILYSSAIKHWWIDSLFSHPTFSEKIDQKYSISTSASVLIVPITLSKKGQLWLSGSVFWDVFSSLALSDILVWLAKYLPVMTAECFLNSETVLKTKSLVPQSFIIAR